MALEEARDQDGRRGLSVPSRLFSPLQREEPVLWSGIDNTPAALASEVAAAGPHAEAAMEACCGWHPTS
jgi:hypothetical protein